MKLCHSRLARRALGLSAVFFSGLFLASAASRPARAAEKTRLRVDDYQIDVELLPQTHKLTAHATVKVTALEDLNVATFQLNNALRITKLTDANNKPLTPERNTQDSTVRFALNSGIAKNTSTTFTFEYEGTLESADDSPVQGLKLAYVGPDTSYLLYSGLWFPVAGYGVNRFTVDHQRDRSGAHGGDRQREGNVRESRRQRRKPRPRLANAKTFTFTWDKPSFPGTIIAGTFQEFKSDEAGIDLHVFFKPNQQDLGAEYASTAVKAFTYFVTQYGIAPSTRLKIVEIPDDTVPSAWAPEIAALSSRAITEKINYRLAGQYDCPSVVGRVGESGIERRLVDQRRLRALLRSALCRERGGRSGARGNGEGHVGGRARL